MTLNMALAAIAGWLPSLDGRIGQAQPEDIVAGGSADLLEPLLRHWQVAHPEAGPHYWAARSWAMLVWQPLYLAVLATHGCGLMPRLAGMSQRLREGVVSGFCLRDAAPISGSEQGLIDAAAEECRLLCTTLFASFSAKQKLHPKLAGRFQADFLVAAVLHFGQNHAGWGLERIEKTAQRWLAAFHLEGACDLVRVPLADGTEKLALARKACCQSFRCRDGEWCSSCPKLKAEQRLARLRQELEAC
ncbi:siderophore ferric iron reductase [Chromobacterium sp. IIBBL 290-4]|uniref:siderophore ferric iron reductase n=1 Tax=Chromobacterium sp. IIBBL 290-4 TaxID=2953890 RepID=UPI0020B6CFF0|nr:siderophore ferric iron reductase [Chromobacterium sp. IIBBL 290-4]UTH74399.1 siderophore ferric iron reductase [Chromobacterium sp. IIBBL 290-4]